MLPRGSCRRGGSRSERSRGRCGRRGRCRFGRFESALQLGGGPRCSPGRCSRRCRWGRHGRGDRGRTCGGSVERGTREAGRPRAADVCGGAVHRARGRGVNIRRFDSAQDRCWLLRVSRRGVWLDRGGTTCAGTPTLRVHTRHGGRCRFLGRGRRFVGGLFPRPSRGSPFRRCRRKGIPVGVGRTHSRGRLVLTRLIGIPAGIPTSWIRVGIERGDLVAVEAGLRIGQRGAVGVGRVVQTGPLFGLNRHPRGMPRGFLEAIVQQRVRVAVGGLAVASPAATGQAHRTNQDQQTALEQERRAHGVSVEAKQLGRTTSPSVPNPRQSPPHSGSQTARNQRTPKRLLMYRLFGLGGLSKPWRLH